jgi:hypothetical protein
MVQLSIVMKLDQRRSIRHDLTKGQYVIGRSSDVDVSIDSQYVSVRHARLLVEDDGAWIIDLNSTNGTRVNGRSASDWTRIKHGDLVLLGQVETLVESQPVAGRSQRPAAPPAPGHPGPAPAQISGKKRRRGRMRRVFISYSRSDADIADLLAAHLQRNGWDVWMDRSSIRSGDNWKRELATGIRAASALVVLATESATVESDWVEVEVDAAFNNRVPILPVYFGNPRVPEQLRLIMDRYERIHVHTLDGATLDEIEGDLQAIASRVGAKPHGTWMARVGSLFLAIGTLGMLGAMALFFYFGFQFVQSDSEFADFGGPPPAADPSEDPSFELPDPDDLEGSFERNRERFEESQRQAEERRRQLQQAAEENSRAFNESLQQSREGFEQTLIAFPVFLGGMVFLVLGQLLQRSARRRRRA